MKHFKSKLDRQSYIVSILKGESTVSVMHLAETLDVTPETIRSDLKELEQHGEIKRIHGGAKFIRKSKSELEYNKRLVLNEKEKRMIAKTGASLIKDGDKVAMDIGTTVFYMADYLEDLENITIITNSIGLAKRLNEKIERKFFSGHVIVLPGYSNPEQQSIKGALTNEILERFRVSKAFISCGSIYGKKVYDYDLEEVHVSKTMMKISDYNILLCDTSKFSDDSFYEIEHLKSFDLTISNGAPKKEWRVSDEEWIVTE